MAKDVHVLDFDNCEGLTKYLLTDLISLTGYYGLPFDGFKYEDNIHFYAAYKERHKTVYIEFENVYIKEFVATIYLEDKIIENESIKKAEANEGGKVKIPERLGLKMLISQINAAKKLGFSQLELLAWGGNKNWHDKTKPIDACEKEFTGYFYWGELGYTMVPSDITKFDFFKQSWNVEHPTLFDLLMDIEEKKVWYTNGGFWSGYFEVNSTTDTQNIISLREYISKKSLDYIV